MIHYLDKLYIKATRRNLLKLFQFYAGDGAWYSTLISFFPKNVPIIEVFGGSGTITLNYPLALAYNDIDPLLYNVFWCTKRDPERVIEYVTKYYPSTVFEREKMKEYIRFLDKKMRISKNPYELAGLFITRYSLALKGEKSLWLASTSSRFVKPQSRIKAIRLAHRRLQRILISNRDFEEIMKLYNGTKIAFYLDPPWYNYTADNDSYTQMSLRDWKRFFNILSKIENPIIIKHRWDTSFLARLPKEHEWYVAKIYIKVSTIKSTSKWMIVRNFY